MSNHDPIESLYGDFSATVKTLSAASEHSFASVTQQAAAKSLLLSAASRFESLMTRAVVALFENPTGTSTLQSSFVEKKALARQFHSLFDWETNNANRFYSFFGPDFKNYMINCLAKDDLLRAGVSDFLSLGAERNKLVHLDFVTYSLDRTLDEIIDQYRSALYFVEQLPTLFQRFDVPLELL